MTNENVNEKDNLILKKEEQNEKMKEENIDSNQEVNEEKEILDDKSKEIEELRQKLSDKENECQSYVDLLKRTMADFDNFRKRTQKEKETIYTDGFVDAIKELLPVLDNLERAVAHVEDNESNPLVEGIQMTLKLFKDTLQKMGVEEIKSEGEKFDPNYHNAIMHVQDENYDENIIVEVFQKGYKYKDKIIRYSLVKVAN
ncbi:nucleotide exchange factor GrpE [Caloramator australicus]|uniref:Protein GrpE n=1 Tax=Caloramator australicus RC3 TaxID=857293 RepID=I7LHY6_9CLOT|nr:nucleotide exchange factor GrpE [Caloramator australicus]CCJ34386.1 Heat shock protein GrpE [Caloramator australicus RC3]